MEQFNRVRGIAHDLDVAKITLRGVPDRPGIAAAVFEPLAAAAPLRRRHRPERLRRGPDRPHVHRLQGRPRPRHARSSSEVAREIGAGDVATDDRIGKVSIVGTGIQSAPGFASRMFRCLSDAGINIEMISTSEIRITCIVAEDRVADAVRALHKAFELEHADPAELA